MVFGINVGGKRKCAPVGRQIWRGVVETDVQEEME